MQCIAIPLLCALAAYQLVALQLLPPWIEQARAAAHVTIAAARGHIQTLSSPSGVSSGSGGLMAGGEGGELLNSLGQRLEMGLAWTALAVDRLLPPLIVNAALTERRPASAPSTESDAQFTSPLYAGLATLLLAYLVSRSFASVIACAVDTVFVCTMQDATEYGGKLIKPSLQESAGRARIGSAGRTRKGAGAGAGAGAELL